MFKQFFIFYSIAFTSLLIKMNSLVGLVTGAASGMGKATALRLLQNGMRVITLDKTFSEDNQENYSKFFVNSDEDYEKCDLKKNCMFVKGDILDSAHVEQAINVGIKLWGKLNVVVNCAGIANNMLIFNRKTNQPVQLKPMQTVVNTNVCGTFNVIRLAARAIANSSLNSSETDNCVIINASGIDGKDSPIRGSVNAATCGAIESMTLPISRDLSSLGIRVVTIAPGFFDSHRFEKMSDDVRTFLSQCNIFPNRFGHNEEFTSCVITVIENQMLNGEVIRLDAGCFLPHFDFN